MEMGRDYGKSERVQKPCKYCRLVTNTSNCNNMTCPRWQAWWKDEWERTRMLFRQAKNTPPETNPYAFRYETPDLIRKYIAEDPCDKCQIPKSFCSTPCMSKKQWLDVKKEVES